MSKATSTWTHAALFVRLIRAVNDNGFSVVVHPDGKITLEAKQ